MRYRCWVPGLLSLLACLWGAASAQALEAEAIDLILKDSLKTFQVPGLAVAIVQNDEVLYLKGVGVRKIGTSEPMTADTVVGIGSLTKAFTAVSLGILVDEGKVNWDDHVRKHLPWFRLSDPLADRDVTLRDLLCHRTGLASHELLWYRASWPVEESVRRLAYLEPASSFRSSYRYNNLAYLAAGLAVSSAAGTPWHEFVQKRIFDPLDMKNAVFTRSAAEKLPDHGTPHHVGADGKVEVIPWYPDDKQIRASGSIKTSARELTKWLRLQLNGGSFEGKRVISAKSLAQTHMPQIVTPVDPDLVERAGTTQASYGLGWHIFDYQGHQILQHGGAVDGFRTRMLLLPRSKLGMVLLTNVDDPSILDATSFTLVDHLLKLSKKDWVSLYRDRRGGPSTGWLPAHQPHTKPSRDLEAYVGTYEEPAYGSVGITLTDGSLRLNWSSFHVPLEHYHYDTFLPKDPGKLKRELLTFGLRPDGEVGTVRFLKRTFKRK